MWYVMKMEDRRFYLVGPFACSADAGTWGSDPKNNPEDDPRWQVLELADASAPVEIVSPNPTRGHPPGVISLGAPPARTPTFAEAFKDGQVVLGGDGGPYVVRVDESGTRRLERKG